LAQPGALLHDPDTYLHIAAGRWMLTHGALPVRDPFSYTFAGARWVPHEWLAELVMAAVYRVAGWSGLVLLTIACFAASLALLTRFLLRRAEPFSALIAVALAAAMVEGHLLARPHLLAMPLLVLWSGMLFAARDAGRAPPFWLLPVMALWANLHDSYLFGLLLACYLAGEAALAGPWRLAVPRWGLFAVLALAAALLTPNGLAGLTQPFRLMAMPALQASFIEWRSPDFQEFQPLEIMLLGLIALGLTTGVRVPPTRVLVLVGLCHMALAHIRHTDLLGLVGPLAVAGSLGPQLAARIRATPPSSIGRIAARLAGPAAPAALALGCAAAIAISLPLLLRPIVRTGDAATPAAAMAAATRLGLSGRVFNSEGFGGYLAFRGVPTFIDGRIELFGNAFLARYLDAINGNASVLHRLLDRWQVGWALLQPQDPAIGILDRQPGWRRVYSDARAVIFVHTGRQPSGASRSRSSPGRLSAAERVDLGIFREPPELLFRKGELAVDGDLEHTARPFDELDLGTVLFFESRPRTEGSGQVVSRHAVFDPDLHRRYLRKIGLDHTTPADRRQCCVGPCLGVVSWCAAEFPSIRVIRALPARKSPSHRNKHARRPHA
jgi:hypothetical protein